MKSKALVLSLVLVSAASAQYCANAPVGFNCAIDEYIASVQIDAFTNASACGPGYEDYTGLTVNVTPGVASAVTVIVGGWYSTGDTVTIFADWNGDLDFTDAGESYPIPQTGPNLPGGMVTYSGTLTPPVGAVPSTRLRVVLFWVTVPTPCDPGGVPEFFGNVEDYTVSSGGAFTLTFSSPLGAGSIQMDIANGPGSGGYLAAITLNAGAYPSGWFFGVDIPIAELGAEINLGFPFVGPLDGAGNITVGPFTGLPAITLYGVALGFPAGTTPTVNTPPTTHSIP
jgi:hypothetical protein